MARIDPGAYVSLCIAGILGILTALVYQRIKIGVFMLDILDISILIGSLALIIIAILVYKDNYNKMISWIGIAISSLMIISLSAVVPGMLGMIGSIVALRRSV